jgi:hypothetical protein
MQKLEDFNQFIETEAIAVYLRSFGYKAKVDNNALVTYVQYSVGDTFVVLAIANWDTAREFIKVRAAEL